MGARAAGPGSVEPWYLPPMQIRAVSTALACLLLAFGCGGSDADDGAEPGGGESAGGESTGAETSGEEDRDPGAEDGGGAELAVTFEPGAILVSISGFSEPQVERIENPLGGCVLPSQTTAPIPPPPEGAEADLSWRCRGSNTEHVYHLRLAPASVQIVRGVRQTRPASAGPEPVGELTYERVTEISFPADMGMRITTR